MFDIFRFLQDYNIDHATSGNKHCGPGWVHVHCPFCQGSKNYHLGIKLNEDYGNCWRCKGKSLWIIVKTLAKCRSDQVNEIISRYSDGRKIKSTKSIIHVDIGKQVHLPTGSERITDRHISYLERRNFDPIKLERQWRIKGTGPIGDYKHRVIIPIFFDGKLVSFQGRDITNKSELKYKACSIANEAIHHKHILYGWDRCNDDTAVVVEGVMDVWRLGPGALGTFGTGYTPQQANLLARFNRVFICFDPEPAAQKTADELAWYVRTIGSEVYVIELDNTDPGDMRQDDANHLMKELGVI